VSGKRDDRDRRRDEAPRERQGRHGGERGNKQDARRDASADDRSGATSGERANNQDRHRDASAGDRAAATSGERASQRDGQGDAPAGERDAASATSPSRREERSPGKRLFVGVRVSVQTANALASVAESLARRTRDAGIDLKWVAPVSYHVTLQFLGWTRIDAIGAIRDALEAALVGTEPLTFRTARLGAFPSLDKASVLWAGVEPAASRVGAGGAGPLDELHRKVACAMSAVGYSPESRPFQAHVTLGRLRETRPVKDVVLPLSEQMFSDTRVDGVTLFESETKSPGSVYREIHRIAFKTGSDASFAAEKRQTGAVELGDETDDGWPRGHSH
jgi:RNA 2',3'-cyclic 3'-phosphodiesterase